MRSRHTHILFGLLVGLLTPAIIGCGSSADPGGRGGAQASAAEHPFYSGEDVFRGVMFGTGPVAELLPEIWKRPELARAASRAKSAEFQPQLQARTRARTWTWTPA
jgi:hypothetical protein